jgi:hypothetical protein
VCTGTGQAALDAEEAAEVAEGGQVHGRFPRQLPEIHRQVGRTEYIEYGNARITVHRRFFAVDD